MIPTPYKIIATLLATISILIAIIFYGHYQYTKGVKITTLVYETAIAKQKNDAAQLLVSVTTQVAAKEQSLQNAKNTQDIIDAQHTKTVSNLSSKLRNALDSASRVCDSSSGRGCGGGSASGQTVGSTDASANSTANADGVLSANLAGLLQKITLEADTINDAYASCRADSFAIRTLTK